MSWTDIADGAVDAESPTPSSLAVQYRDNAEYNFLHALRGGTNDTGVRLAIARGEVAFNTTGTDIDFSQAVVFATDAEDGDPDFGGVPTVILKLEEDLTGDSWSDNNVWIKRLHIQSGTLDASGFTAEWNATQTSSTVVKGKLVWLAVGVVGSESVYTTIAGTDTDQNSPFEEDLTEGLRDNQVYNHDSAIRCGTHVTGTRLAIARGTSVFTMGGTSAYDFIQVTFATDAEDGDPNFSSTPVILLSIEEDTSVDDDWVTNDAVMQRLHISLTDEGGTYVASAADYFYYSIQVNDGNAAHGFGGNLHWIAIGPVTTGE